MYCTCIPSFTLITWLKCLTVLLESIDILYVVVCVLLLLYCSPVPTPIYFLEMCHRYFPLLKHRRGLDLKLLRQCLSMSCALLRSLVHITIKYPSIGADKV